MINSIFYIVRKNRELAEKILAKNRPLSYYDTEVILRLLKENDFWLDEIRKKLGIKTLDNKKGLN